MVSSLPRKVFARIILAILAAGVLSNSSEFISTWLKMSNARICLNVFILLFLGLMLYRRRY